MFKTNGRGTNVPMRERNREILAKRLGGMSLQAVADLYGISKERCRQIVRDEFIREKCLELAQNGERMDIWQLQEEYKARMPDMRKTAWRPANDRG